MIRRVEKRIRRGVARRLGGDSRLRDRFCRAGGDAEVGFEILFPCIERRLMLVGGFVMLVDGFRQIAFSLVDLRQRADSDEVFRGRLEDELKLGLRFVVAVETHESTTKGHPRR